MTTAKFVFYDVVVLLPAGHGARGRTKIVALIAGRHRTARLAIGVGCMSMSRVVRATHR